ncbi:hypothetical protein SAMN04488540_11672 [Ferrimonas sediminum]|uniref:Uncharacterized protein n=1 Tax=Ferrimonas sediminum TaxID=718193 RepID=A0A1G8Y1K9_9GAMM|nr:hypothetical protein [Ferrimonas sediminum]SDJ96676.1 hypothetical protein SAMN04488540_11672 [Ferrimonas sediminum]
MPARVGMYSYRTSKAALNRIFSSAAEVMVDGDRMHLIREREQPEQLWRGEHCLPEA